MTSSPFSPGTLVTARGRTWVVLMGSSEDTLRLRPLSGSEADVTVLRPALELEPIQRDAFPPPSPSQLAGHDASLLLRDALLLSLRRGAGPFRSFGQISVEPRAYQLVPLLMALKLDPVRLLIADDVGVGKTIEAALIARELMDRGEVERFTVLCPPHLVEQWVQELQERFHIRAVPVTAASAARLERDNALSESIFKVYPQTVVSLDYIKSERRRADFLRACPELVVVDEAHACAPTGAGRHQRYELLAGLAASSRHMLLLTATPHSGDDDAFYKLLGLLDRDFLELATLTGNDRERLRDKLSRHFVQRRRPDIEEWREGRLFPKHESGELTYTLSGEWDAFFRSVLDYCSTTLQKDGAGHHFYRTLSLMRCASSSPVAAAIALRSKAGETLKEQERAELIERLFDGSGSDVLPESDVEPALHEDEQALQALIAAAERLTGQAGDPKLKKLTSHLQELLTHGFSPVVFCRYIATAHYLRRNLQDRFKGVVVEVVTGELTAEERREKVEALDSAERRLLIATDCLSEGINLQESFNAVVHYDLSWNPTRHEQREGRVDRFGQRSETVRTTLMYGANNPVDGVVLEVILRKAERIRKELGVPVPLPDDDHTLTQALLKAILLRSKPATTPVVEQMPLFANLKEVEVIEARWTSAAQKAKQNRTIFAQRRLRPEDVLPEWHRTLAAIGGKEDVKRFASRALAWLGSGMDSTSQGYKIPLSPLPVEVRERLDVEGLRGTLLVDFDYPAHTQALSVQRSHPLISVLAETLLERSLNEDADPRLDAGTLGRVGCWISAAVKTRTIVALLRLRHQLVRKKSRKSMLLLVEEASALAWAGAEPTQIAEGQDALALLAPPPAGEPPPVVREREINKALQHILRHPDLDAFAHRRAQTLLTDHERVRVSAQDGGRHDIGEVLSPDVISLVVLLPRLL